MSAERITVELFYFDAGGGHRSAMNSATAILKATRPHWVIKAVNLQELFQSIDPVFITTRIKSENIYNAALKRGWTRNSRPLLRALQAAIKLHAPIMERQLVRHWRRELPDLVVSLIPISTPCFSRRCASSMQICPTSR